MAIVSHYYTIEYISAVDYMQCGAPKYYLDVKNCIPYYADSGKLIGGRGGRGMGKFGGLV